MQQFETQIKQQQKQIEAPTRSSTYKTKKPSSLNFHSPVNSSIHETARKTKQGGVGETKKPKNQKKTLKICGDRETVHLREEDLTRTASLEVGKARERGGGGGGRPRRRTRPNSARNCESRETQGKKERKREFTKARKIRKISKPKNTELITSKNNCSDFYFLWLIFAIFWGKTSFI
jgi:hypothetical protein